MADHVRCAIIVVAAAVLNFGEGSSGLTIENVQGAAMRLGPFDSLGKALIDNAKGEVGVK